MKTQSKGPSQPSSPKPEALDEKITHLTEEVAKKANLYKVPALIALVLVIAIMAIVTISSSLGEQAEAELSAKVTSLFQKDPETGEFVKTPAEIRSGAESLAGEVKGEKIEPFFTARYAAWLVEQNEGNDRQQALSLLSDALGRHDDNILLSIANDELTQVKEASEGFTLPPIPEPDPPIEPDPVTPEGTVTPPAPPAGAGTETPDGTSTDETGAGTTEPVTPPTDAPAGGR